VLPHELRELEWNELAIVSSLQNDITEDYYTHFLGANQATIEITMANF
jgi:hypothetical protein